MFLMRNPIMISMMTCVPQLHYVRERALESTARLTSRIGEAKNYEGRKLRAWSNSIFSNEDDALPILMRDLVDDEVEDKRDGEWRVCVCGCACLSSCV